MSGIDVVVRVARAGEVADAARPLVDSHLDDPGMVAFFPDPSVRPRAVSQVFGLTVADALAVGHVYVGVVDGRIVGTAAWLPPRAFPPGGARRALASVPSVWFLAGLGEPEIQRGGVGGRLMRPVLARADADGTHCVLNTQNEANHAYYRRFGFEVARDAWRAGGGPTSWTMRRPAR